MGNLFPKDWKIRRLNELGESYSGLKSKSKKDFTEDGNARFITYRNINKNYFVDKNDLAPVSVNSSENQNVVLKDDVLFTGSSETPEEVAFSSVMNRNIKDMYLNSFSFGYRFSNLNQIDSIFYGYFFRSEFFRKVVFPLAQGSTRYNISRNELLKIEVPVPPLKEQQKIAAILSSVDEAIEKTEEIIEQTEKVKKGLMQELLTKGIGHTEFNDSPVGKVPKVWNVMEGSSLYTAVSGYSPSRLTFSSNGDLLYFKVNDMNSRENKKYINVSELIFNGNENENINYYPENTIVFPKRGAAIFTNKIGILSKKASFDTNIMGLICNENINHEFLFYYLKYYGLFNISDNSGVPQLNNKHIYPLLIPVPPLDEQTKISNILNSIFEKIEVEQAKKLKLLNKKQGLMQELLTGKKRVKIDDSQEVLS